MIKITTKRDERIDEALREEGRREAISKETNHSLDLMQKQENVWTKDAEIIPATLLCEGDYLFESDGIRGGHRGCRISFADNFYPEGSAKPGPTREGTRWVIYESDPEKGVLNSGGSLLNDDDMVLIVKRDHEPKA